MIIPIRTETTIRRTPFTNYALIGVNVLLFALLGTPLGGTTLASLRNEYLVFDSVEPTLLQFFSYQFLHADKWHLLGNMFILWFFGRKIVPPFVRNGTP